MRGRMKTFYLMRSEDVHGNSGTGVVAEGIIFDSGMVAMTWLSDIPTVTSFRRIQDVAKLHGHEGRTIVIVEGNRRQKKQFEKCQDVVRIKKSVKRVKELKEVA